MQNREFKKFVFAGYENRSLDAYPLGELFAVACIGHFSKKQCLQIVQNGEIEKVFDYRVQKCFSRRLPPERIFSFPQKYRPPKTIQIPRSLHAKSVACPDRKEVNRAE